MLQFLQMSVDLPAINTNRICYPAFTLNKQKRGYIYNKETSVDDELSKYKQKQFITFAI